MSPMQEIVLASGNAAKLRELQETLGSAHIRFIPQTGLAIPDAVEDGLSFVENALIKARHASQLSGLPALADDSGLEVDALGGEPGIHSARYAADEYENGANGNSDDEANNRKLLERLAAVPMAQRSARFHCVIVFMRHARDPVPLICQGSWEGRILPAPVGHHGFGYDPLFYVPSHDCSSAQLPPEIKNRLSHRGQAIRQLLARWAP
ncbi:MAG: RdgB/HAM1 family non-canonical purine NTP pyrophosphatase [Pseudomonadales bacterium]|nr:RdgB/HAM1 family non-canonical purine NTP pyrophosphatase [Pseudomonadales bacterium]